MRTLRLPLGLLLLAFAAGCGSAHIPGHDPAGAAPGGNQPGKTAAKADAPASPDADMVAAVSSGGSGPPISVRFRLGTRPVVGAPAAVSLELLPTPGLSINHVHASMRGDDGLQLQGAPALDVEDPADGSVLAQEVTVIPQREGVLSMSVIVVVDYDKNSVARTYVIPIVAASAGAS